jgi:hypothetical protein
MKVGSSAHREQAAAKGAISDQQHAERGDQIRGRQQLPRIIDFNRRDDRRQELDSHKQGRVIDAIKIERRFRRRDDLGTVHDGTAGPPLSQ